MSEELPSKRSLPPVSVSFWTVTKSPAPLKAAEAGATSVVSPSKIARQ